jgi:hypothetical protein
MIRCDVSARHVFPLITDRCEFGRNSISLHDKYLYHSYKYYKNLVSDYSWDSSVSIVTRPQPGKSGVWILAAATDFSLLPGAQTGSGAQPASCSVSAVHGVGACNFTHFPLTFNVKQEITTSCDASFSLCSLWAEAVTRLPAQTTTVGQSPPSGTHECVTLPPPPIIFTVWCLITEKEQQFFMWDLRFSQHCY